MTDWSYYEAARRFQRVLVAAGVDAALKARGVMVRRAATRGHWTACQGAGGGGCCCMTVACVPRKPQIGRGDLARGGRTAARLGSLLALACMAPPIGPHIPPNPTPTHTHTHTPPPPSPPQDGDTVVIGDLEFEYSSDHSEAGMYERWYSERRAAGVVGKGQARWPHVTG